MPILSPRFFASHAANSTYSHHLSLAKSKSFIVSSSYPNAGTSEQGPRVTWKIVAPPMPASFIASRSRTIPSFVTAVPHQCHQTNGLVLSFRQAGCRAINSSMVSRSFALGVFSTRTPCGPFSAFVHVLDPVDGSTNIVPRSSVKSRSNPRTAARTVSSSHEGRPRRSSFQTFMQRTNASATGPAAIP